MFERGRFAKVSIHLCHDGEFWQDVPSGSPFKDSETADHPNRVFLPFIMQIRLLSLDNPFKEE